MGEINLKVTDVTHRLLKSKASLKGCSLHDYVVGILQEALESGQNSKHL